MSGLKNEVVKVPAWEGNRDAGKQFLITEMPAAAAEKWAWRMFLALKGSGSEVPESLVRLGIVGVMFAGFNAFLKADIDPDRLMPLLDEMMTCVQIVRDPRHPEVATPIVSDDDIQEVMTRGWLRAEVLRIHTGFTLVEAILKWISDSKTPETSSTT